MSHQRHALAVEKVMYWSTGLSGQAPVEATDRTVEGLTDRIVSSSAAAPAAACPRGSRPAGWRRRTHRVSATSPRWIRASSSIADTPATRPRAGARHVGSTRARRGRSIEPHRAAGLFVLAAARGHRWIDLNCGWCSGTRTRPRRGQLAVRNWFLLPISSRRSPLDRTRARYCHRP